MEVKRINLVHLLQIFVFLLLASSANADQGKKIYLNAFLETSTAYLNDAFILVGVISDSVMTEGASPDVAAEIVSNLQRRLRTVRAKIRGVLLTKVSLAEKQLLSLLDKSYACLDHQTWSLLIFLKDNAPESAKRFETFRSECLERIQAISDFYAGLPRTPELPEPLSTR